MFELMNRTRLTDLHYPFRHRYSNVRHTLPTTFQSVLGNASLLPVLRRWVPIDKQMKCPDTAL
jgi:hypothetical protein